MQCPLNFHHLHYFWCVAKEGNLTRAAAKLRVAQSAMSSQIRQLEDSLGAKLFERQGRTLALTESGKLALAYAEDIFAAGEELRTMFARGRTDKAIFALGTVATLSRNFQESFVRPLLEMPEVQVRMESGVLDALIDRLDRHELDLVLTNRPPQRSDPRRFRVRRMARQPVSLVGPKRRYKFRFPKDIEEVSLILPTRASGIRAEFDALVERAGKVARVLAEVDDMATMRLLARGTRGVALLPSVVVRDELRDGVLEEYCEVPGLFETFYGITKDRKFPHPLLTVLFKRSEDDVLAMG